MNQQIVNAPSLYVNHAEISYLGTVTLTIAAGQVRDSLNIYDIFITAPTILDASTNGVNGLDTGSLSANTWYAVHVIGDTTNNNPGAVLLSTSSTSPVIPFGYDVFRFRGWMLTDGSSHFLKTYLYGNSSYVKQIWDSPIQVLFHGGHASTYAAVSMTSAAPTTSRLVILDWQFVPNSASNYAFLRPTGSTSTNNIVVGGSVASQSNWGQMNINCNSSQSIDYQTASNSDSLTLNVFGFEYFV